MNFKCHICDTSYRTVKEGYNHNSVHKNTCTFGRYSVTSCTLCLFTHENIAVTKTHCELVHKINCYITHHRFVKPKDAIKQHRKIVSNTSSNSKLLEAFRKLKTRFNSD